jgi:Fic-DOC domain mobile mystery protein B
VNERDETDNATFLTAEEREGIIPSHVTLQRELNELEQQNIVEAEVWAFMRRRDPVAEAFVRNLHRRMFGKVWQWAGAYRTSNKNIGVGCDQIQSRLYETLDNIRYWIEHQTFPPDEITTRFHHALVSIHPFPNGNGRWSRLMADILIVRLGQPRFTWGSSGLRDADATRQAYTESLKAADNHNFSDLIAFVRS